MPHTVATAISLFGLVVLEFAHPWSIATSAMLLSMPPILSSLVIDY